MDKKYFFKWFIACFFIVTLCFILPVISGKTILVKEDYYSEVWETGSMNLTIWNLTGQVDKYNNNIRMFSIATTGFNLTSIGLSKNFSRSDTRGNNYHYVNITYNFTGTALSGGNFYYINICNQTTNLTNGDVTGATPKCKIVLSTQSNQSEVTKILIINYTSNQINASLFNANGGLNNTINISSLTYYYLVMGGGVVNSGGIPNNSFNLLNNFTLYHSDYDFLENSIPYTAIINEGETSTIGFNFTLGDSVSFNYAYLYYNNTRYDPTITNNDKNYFIYETITAPYVTKDTNISFYFEVNTSIGLFNSTMKNQTIKNITLDKCTTNKIGVLNYTLKDEETQVYINETNISVQIELNIYSSDGLNSIINFSTNYSSNNGSICIGALNSTNYLMNGIIRYSRDPDYVGEFYFIRNFNLTNASINNIIDLYDLKTNDNTNFVITFKDSNLIPVVGALVNIKRKYISDGTYKIVEIPITDNNGQAIGHFDTDSVLYEITFIKDNVVLGTFSDVVVRCNDILTGDCTINLNQLSQITPFTDKDLISNTYLKVTFNRTTRIITAIFSNRDGSSSNFFMNTTKYDSFNNLTICTNSILATQNTFTCAVNSLYGNVTIKTEFYKDNNLLKIDIFSINAKPTDIFGNDAYIMVALLMMTLPLMFIPSTVGVLLGFVLGMILSILLGIFGGSFGMSSGMVWLILAISIIIWKISRRNSI